MLADEARAAGQENLHRRYTAIRIVSSAGRGRATHVGRSRGEILTREIKGRDLTGEDRDRLDRDRHGFAAPVGRRPAKPGAIWYDEHDLAFARAGDFADVAVGRVLRVEHRQPDRGSQRALAADTADSCVVPASGSCSPCSALDSCGAALKTISTGAAAKTAARIAAAMVRKTVDRSIVIVSANSHTITCVACDAWFKSYDGH